MQEILVVAAIVLAIYFIPRLTGRKSALSPQQRTDTRSGRGSQAGFLATKISFRCRMRLAIVLTLMWVIACAVYLKPWEGGRLLFILLTVIPAMVFWGAVWVWFGYKKHRR